MTKQDLLNVLLTFTPEQDHHWMLQLGQALTISARASYPVGDHPGNLDRLVGFNEMQHRVYGRIFHLRRGEEWTIESLLDFLLKCAERYEVQDDVGWALKTSIAKIQSISSNSTGAKV